MAVELVTFKLEKDFINEIDSISKKSGFSSRTDFIRNALREKVDDIKLKESLIRLGRLKGKSKKTTSDEEIHEIREKALNDLIKKKGFK